MVDNHQLFGKSKIGTRSAVKNSTRVIPKNRSQSAAQQLPFEPKRRLLDFDESDEILDEERRREGDQAREKEVGREKSEKEIVGWRPVDDAQGRAIIQR